jgi:hypothetical protein
MKTTDSVLYEVQTEAYKKLTIKPLIYHTRCVGNKILCVGEISTHTSPFARKMLRYFAVKEKTANYISQLISTRNKAVLERPVSGSRSQYTMLRE